MSEIVVTEDNNGGSVALRVDDALMIRLQESPTTGFRWTLTTTDNPLEIAADAFAPGSSAATGGSGVRTFRFLAKRKGRARLQFKLAREWEASAPAKDFALEVVVS